VLTTTGRVDLSVPRDRTGGFEPQIVPKRRRRLPNIDELVLSLYARCVSTRQIKAHLEVYGLDVSHEWDIDALRIKAATAAPWSTRPQAHPGYLARRERGREVLAADRD
jgi:putative transposase